MEGFLWLLLQTLPLITAAAVLFFILGWRWRGHHSQRDHRAQDRQIDAENIEAQTARQERDAARALEEKLRQKLTETQAELQESNDRQSQLQKEILRLSDELKAARESAPAPAPAPVSIVQEAAPRPAAPVGDILPASKPKSSKSGARSRSKKPRPPKS
ncbi:hypothetical protein WJU23_18415 [Prosthecobacter sp. SYSU 5D2]|uniref:hypothetical protein n=1 Tax=Prosthecobacter sp. SYSU 5D2 TaxID=3134134 RepID=UPI0031FEF4DB